MIAFLSGCLARYMNCVAFDVIHSSVNPTILCFAVFHYYGNSAVPHLWTAIRSVHKALLQYVNHWLPGTSDMQDKLGDLKVTDFYSVYGLSWHDGLLIH